MKLCHPAQTSRLDRHDSCPAKQSKQRLKLINILSAASMIQFHDTIKCVQITQNLCVVCTLHTQHTILCGVCLLHTYPNTAAAGVCFRLICLPHCQTNDTVPCLAIRALNSDSFLEKPIVVLETSLHAVMPKLNLLHSGLQMLRIGRENVHHFPCSVGEPESLLEVPQSDCHNKHLNSVVCTQQCVVHVQCTQHLPITGCAETLL